MSPREVAGKIGRRSGAFVVAASRGSSRWLWRVVSVTFQFLAAPLVDRWTGLSLTRFIAIFCCVVVGHEIFVHEKSLSWVDFWLIVSAIGTAFGKMTFEAVLQRLGLRSTSADLTQTVDVRIQEIQERRAAATKDGWPGKEPA